jgi:succinyl-diaminopimelate desuccinylase
MSDTLDLAIDLVRRPSITPDDAGCQDILIARLERLGFSIERLPFGPVNNFWARRGDTAPLCAFAGHTDVVPPGPMDPWQHPPFAGTVQDGFLWGRGSADMKGSLAAMVTACEQFLTLYPDHGGSIGFLITSDEEGVAEDGTVKVIQYLEARGEKIDYCVVGEPSSHERLGDTLKNGRRGSLNGILRLQGVQGHVAYPERVQNPIHVLGGIISALTEEVWDQGNEFFPPTSFQISNVHGGTGAVNVVPGEAEIRFNFRFSPETTVDRLQSRVQSLIDTQLLNEEVKSGQVFQYNLDWQVSGQPFLTLPGELVQAAISAIQETLHVDPTLSTSGGTSDGRFIAPTGAQVIELGPINATIHKLNERVSVQELDLLSQLYQTLLIKLFKLRS